MDNHDLDHGNIDPRIEAAANEGCEESRWYLNRRAVLGVTATLSAWAFLPRSASAAGDDLREKRLFVVLLQGGMDGLHVVPPVGDPSYVSQRRLMALDPAKLLPLESSNYFYFNTSMPNFYRAYQQKQAAIVHAIAPPLRSRSHFECMYNLESGLGGQQVRSSKTGWMNRLLDHLPLGENVMSNGLKLGNAPLIMTGPQPVLSWTPDRWPKNTEPAQSLYDTLTADGRKTDAVLSRYLSRGARIREMALAASDGKPVVNAAFHGAGNLMKAPNGPRISAMQIVSFDTHVGEAQGLAGMLSALDSWIQDFREALGEDAWANTVVACVSEFGRTVRDNGRNGTDHGVGTAALLIGGAVNGGRVITDWPGLATLQDGRDLRATVCTRKLFKGILQDHLGITREALDANIFPDSENIRPMEGLIRGVAARTRTAASGTSAASPAAGSGQMAQAQTGGSMMQ